MNDLQPAADMFGSAERWIVEVTLASTHPPTERGLDAMADLADDRDITVAGRAPADSAGIVFTAEVPAHQIGQVPGWTFAIAEEACGYGVEMDVALVDLRVCTPEVHEAAALRPDTPELLAATDVATLLGVSRQRVHQLAERADFPAPYQRLGSGPVWTRPVIEAFDRSWTRKPGRPSRRAS